MTKSSRDQLQTRLIHAGEPSPVEGAVVMPIFQSATYEYAGEGTYHDVRYVRLNNTPNHRVLHQKLADICGGEAALTTSSGMAAITTALLSVCRPGDHILAQSDLYGGTHHFLRHDIRELGIEVDFVTRDRPDTWASLVKPTTRVIYMESLTNPLVRVADLTAAVALAKAHGLVSMIDNTFATPVNFLPLAMGFDLSLHSATKYLNGHSDIVAGCAVGSEALIGAMHRKLNHLGGCLDPHACFLLHRGIKTLRLRVLAQNANALALAQLLEKHKQVERVHYPGLETHVHHQRATQWFAGCGGVLSFELRGDVTRAEALIASLRLAKHAPSLGGVETLVTRPATTSHAGVSEQERHQLGISDRLVRVAIGIEDPRDLCLDFQQALDALPV